jgi:hypothetical protein
VFYFHFIGLYELLAALPAQLQPHVDSQEDLTFLWDVFGEKSLHSLVKVSYTDVRFSLQKADGKIFLVPSSKPEM